MKLFEKFKFNKLSRILQGQKNQARHLLKASLEVGFTMPEIRRGLIAFYGVNVSRLVNGHGITSASLYATLTGARRNALAQKLLSESLGLTVEEFFPEGQAGGSRGADRSD